MPTPKSHSKRDVIFTNTYQETDLNFIEDTGNLVSDVFDISLSSALSLFITNDSSVTVSLVDKEASDHLGEDVVLATASGTDIILHKPLLRQGAFGKAFLKFTGITELPENLKLLMRTTNEFGNAST